MSAQLKHTERNSKQRQTIGEGFDSCRRYPFSSGKNSRESPSRLASQTPHLSKLPLVASLRSSGRDRGNAVTSHPLDEGTSSALCGNAKGTLATGCHGCRPQ